MATAHIFKKGVEKNMLYSWFSAMHTRMDVAIVSNRSKDKLLPIVENVRSRVGEIEAAANCYDPASQLAKFNAGNVAREDLCPELQRILSLCDYWKKATGGLFDVAVEGKINLSGFLKGYVLDEILPILKANGVASALVNFGNSSVIAVGSQHGDGNGWTVANRNGEKFVLRDECLTTSGNDSPQRRHIKNPLTGKYVEGQRMVSVVTKGGAEGEVRATVAFLENAIPRR